MNEQQTIVFWSWQTDSPAKTNRNFIEDCLERAVKQIARISATIIKVDRDTKGVGGSPSIADTILKKIKASDIFVWDATLVSLHPRYSPNPNVLIELGYAMAIMGEGRIIGIMNTKETSGPENLPFDLKHRRGPITYALGSSSSFKGEDYNAYRKTVRDKLIETLIQAIQAALDEPKAGAIRSDVDLQIALTLWGLIDSKFLKNWCEWRMYNIQHERHDTFQLMLEYIDRASMPENKFGDEDLRTANDAFCRSLDDYTGKVSVNMAHDGHKGFVINTKAVGGWIEDYDERYDRECDILREAIESVWHSWEVYISSLRARYPEVIYTIKKTKDT